MNRKQEPTKDLYAILEADKSATDDEIKKAYKKVAFKHHPDRNPDTKEESTAKFQEIGNAFKILGDPEKRKRYDQFGVIDGEDGGGGGGMPGGMNPFDIFQNMFGGGGGMPGGMGGMFGGMGGMPGGGGNVQQNRSAKSPDKKLTINLSLSDVYKGKSVPIDFAKVICCDKCDGCGAVSKDSIKSCKSCNGQGRIVRMIQMGPMIQQTVQACGACAGKGKGVEQGKECVKCKGGRTSSIKRHVDCYVRPGTQAGASVTFKNESDWAPDCNDIGDLVVFINSKNEEGAFRREGNNLIMKKSITLLEALTKTEFYFKHMDDRVIKITHEDVIKPGQKMIVKGEGMVDQTHNGDLIIYFDIVFPPTLDKERSKYLVKILPLPRKQIWDLQFESMPKEDITELGMSYMDNDELNNGKERKEREGGGRGGNGENGDVFDEEEEGQREGGGGGFPGFGGGRPVECATQ